MEKYSQCSLCGQRINTDSIYFEPKEFEYLASTIKLDIKQFRNLLHKILFINENKQEYHLSEENIDRLVDFLANVKIWKINGKKGDLKNG